MKHTYLSPQLVLLTMSTQDVLTVSLMRDQGVNDIQWIETPTPTIFE